MHLLLETSAGYGLFKVKNKISKIDNWADYENFDELKNIVELVAFKEFKDLTEGLRSNAKTLNNMLSKNLKKFLVSNLINKDLKDNLIVAEKNFAKLINEKLDIDCTYSKKNDSLFRCIRFCVSDLVSHINNDDMNSMSIGLAHGLGRFKLKFSADKVDTMIIQAINLQQDLDKEINNYMMRLKEWYGYHFPELSNIVTDNILYTKAVRLIGDKINSREVDLESIFNEEIVEQICYNSDISIGAEIDESDILFVNKLADQIIELDEYRTNLNEYLKERMMAVSPNLTSLVGENIAAKLISKAGSLINLAKMPASTIQILGAEKALFKAMKSKKNTPKYGIIYHAKLVSGTQGKVKGKISRALAAKASLCVRVDALNEEDEGNNVNMGNNSKTFLEKKLMFLEKQEEKNPTTKGNNIQRGPSGNTNTKNFNNDFVLNKKRDNTPGKYNNIRGKQRL